MLRDKAALATRKKDTRWKHKKRFEFVWPRSPEFLLSKKPAGDAALTSASECNEHPGHDVLPGVGSFP